ncbi:hypothetical protein I4U23_005383 [Adineta vaga]|nr:hypothetical protein I4U23_005383 [Adineta vaga]
MTHGRKRPYTNSFRRKVIAVYSDRLCLLRTILTEELSIPTNLRHVAVYDRRNRRPGSRRKLPSIYIPIPATRDTLTIT